MLLQPNVHEFDQWVLLWRNADAVLYNRASLSVLAVDPAIDPGVLPNFLPHDGNSISSKRGNVGARSVSRAFTPMLHRQPERLGRLTINIANACNLWCSYCYADHGQYHAPSSLMTPAMAVRVVSRCLELYPSIRSLQFFGGEPLMNLDAIEAVSEYLTTRFGDRCPQLVATTNGTVLSERATDILAKYGISLTVSLDGPSEIHDRLRPAKSLRSSHASAMTNIDTLRRCGIELDIECTYTASHIRSEISVVDLMDYF